MEPNEIEKAAEEYAFTRGLTALHHPYSEVRIDAFKAGSAWAKREYLQSNDDHDNKYLPGRLDFYRKEMQKLREYIEEKNIGKPNQKFFDVMYDYIKELEGKAKQQEGDGLRWVKASDRLPRVWGTKLDPILPIPFRIGKLYYTGWYWDDKKLFVDTSDNWFSPDKVEWLEEPTT